jgi:hypothetical protein
MTCHDDVLFLYYLGDTETRLSQGSLQPLRDSDGPPSEWNDRRLAQGKGAGTIEHSALC